MDLLREQVKMLAGEVALCISSLKRVSEQAAKNPEDLQLQVSALFQILIFYCIFALSFQFLFNLYDMDSYDHCLIKEHMQRLKDEIREKKQQINILEQRMIGSVEMTPKASNNIEMSQVLTRIDLYIFMNILQL